MASIRPRHLYRDNDRAIGLGNEFWNECQRHGLTGIVGQIDHGTLTTDSGHSFINCTVCSYLDLDTHPAVLEGAIEAIRRHGVLAHMIPPSRVRISALAELEESLSDLFGAEAISAISTSAASSGLLPLVASGHLGDGERPLMVFDKYAHVSMANTKPACADETEVVTAAHHDLGFLEDMCRRYRRVCYVTDGADSLGGYAPVEDLSSLQDRYGMIVYYDDSHSTSVYGDRGRGYVRTHSTALDRRTITVTTLGKGFGASGAVVLLNDQPPEIRHIIERFGGPISYSQMVTTAAVGASLASADIHRSAELTALQERLAANIALFDSLVSTVQSGRGFPIRVVPMPDDTVAEAGAKVFAAGYYVSPVFFPIVPRGTAGLRVMIRAGMTASQIRGLGEALVSAGATPGIAGTAPRVGDT